MKQTKLMVAGIGTGVGKTVVAAILTSLLSADYWKPIESGTQDASDVTMIREWLKSAKHRIHPPLYSLKAPLSPHHAAQLEGIHIKQEAFVIPTTRYPLVIEGVGGVLVPLTYQLLSLELFQSWKCQWIIVSQHYLGSINHTLLTIEILKHHAIPILGLVFNGSPNPESEQVILKQTQLPLLGRLFPEPTINTQTIKKYAQAWKQQLTSLLI